MQASNINITRVNNDVSGNPRHVIHYLALLNNEALNQWHKQEIDNKGVWSGMVKNGLTYDIACFIAKQPGFKRYHNRSFGGGLSFSSYNVTSDLAYLDAACERFVVDNTDNEQLTSHVLSCIDPAYIAKKYGNKATLKSIIKQEKRANRLNAKIVEDWLRGLPSSVNIEYIDCEQETILSNCGLVGWNSNMYWRYAAKTILHYCNCQ